VKNRTAEECRNPDNARSTMKQVLSAQASQAVWSAMPRRVSVARNCNPPSSTDPQAAGSICSPLVAATAHSKASFASLATDAAASFTAVPAACAEPRARSSVPGTAALALVHATAPDGGSTSCMPKSHLKSAAQPP